MSGVTPPPAGDTGATAASTPSTTPSTTTTSTTSTTPPVTTSSTPTGGEYFNQSRIKVIGLITAGVVLVGALGGIAGVAFDPERSDDEELFQPGEDAGSLGSVGNSMSRKSLLRAAPKLPADGTGSPTPIGSATPDPTESAGATESPTTGSSPTPPSPSPTDDGTDTGSDLGVTLTATNVQVYVPPGWGIDYTDDNEVLLSDGQGSWSYGFSASGIDPSADAGQLIAENLQNFFPPENYTQFATGDIQALNPFGSVVSIAGMPYETLWVDNQGSVSLHGEIYLAVRQDGTILLITIEHAPVEDWDNAPAELSDIINASYSRFGGIG